MAKTKKSRAEIQRAYQQRQKVKNQEAAKEKERLCWHTRREQHKVRVVADLTARERRSVRKKWRETKAEYRKLQKTLENDSPPVSDRGSPTPINRRGRPRVPYSYRKSYKTIQKLNAALESSDRERHKYKMRWLRIKQRQNPVQHRTDDSNEDVPQAPCLSTPRSKTHTQLQNVRHLISPGAKKSLLFHNVMVDQLARVRRKLVHHKSVQQLLRTYLRSIDFRTLRARLGCQGQLEFGAV